MKPLLIAAVLLCTTLPCMTTAAVARIPQPVLLDAQVLAAAPHEPVQMEVHGETLLCTGVPLVLLLRGADAMPDAPLHGPQLARVVHVSARDGYRVAFSLAELDSALGGTRAFVVDRCGDKPLDEHDGPLRLLVPTDKRAARSVRQLQSIAVDPAA